MTSEDAAFSAIVSWVNHEPDERRHLFEQLFRLIDLQLLSKEFLNNSVKMEVRPLLSVPWLVCKWQLYVSNAHIHSFKPHATALLNIMF